MRILEPGRPQAGWAKEVTCTGAGNEGGGCGAKLLVEAHDLYRTESHARDETTTYVTIMCEACGVETDLWNSDSPSKGLRIPDHVMGALPYLGPAARNERRRGLIGTKRRMDLARDGE
jgi:hypothetical protein